MPRLVKDREGNIVDTLTHETYNREQAVAALESGKYPEYEIVKGKGRSKRRYIRAKADSRTDNNLEI